MGLIHTIEELRQLTGMLEKDLCKTQKGNLSAAQRIRVNTVLMEKVGKKFRRESLLAERGKKRKKPVK